MCGVVVTASTRTQPLPAAHLAAELCAGPGLGCGDPEDPQQHEELPPAVVRAHSKTNKKETHARANTPHTNTTLAPIKKCRREKRDFV
jgi:hypothetical protein